MEKRNEKSLFTICREFGIYSHFHDLRKIGELCSNLYLDIFGERPPKITDKQFRYNIEVCYYNNPFYFMVLRIISEYYNMQHERFKNINCKENEYHISAWKKHYESASKVLAPINQLSEIILNEECINAERINEYKIDKCIVPCPIAFRSPPLIEDGQLKSITRPSLLAKHIIHDMYYRIGS